MIRQLAVMVAALLLPIAVPAPAHAASVAPIDLCAQVDHAAGFRGEPLVTIVAIAMAESSCNPKAFHRNDDVAALDTCTDSIDRGLHQVNTCAHPGVGDDCAYDAQCNADVAYTMSAAGTVWTPWVAYTGGSYRTFVDDARAAVLRLGIEDRPWCVPVTGDWDGNGSTTMGLACKPTSGIELQWELINVNSGGSPQIRGHFGSANCVPVTGDWNGDGTTSIGVACRDANGRILWNLSNGYRGSLDYSFTYGMADTCRPVTGDWDGDGKWGVGVACRTNRSIEIQWSLINTLGGGSPSYAPFGYGSTSCHPVTGDWNANGSTTVGIACPNGIGIQWSLIDSHGGGSPSHTPFGFGNSVSCWPVTGDWNANGSTTIGIVCPGAEHEWSLTNVHSGGSIAVRTNYGTGRSYTTSAGWNGPNWPRWPNPY